ncbi:transglycosylase domain-containing protein [Patescibacteria group bacterium]|nr:transglycosylase domain-containing protein [Patescibacteria group bacterium]MBU1448691.1 transglycosylase domain-containing protein [Patescibacteria group bacterium]MBU2613338.1 transglycosylase domain-containing protein [Patescibacteria group bacterium]
MPIRHLIPTGKFTPNQPNRTMKTRRKKQVKTVLLWVGALGAGLTLLGILGITVAFAWFSRDLPDPNALLERNVPQSTKIYDRTGAVLLYEIHGDEKRTLVKIEEIPDVMKHATIAVEDKDFYSHHGVYWRGIFRAFIMSVLKSQRVQGTSTLTQQFVKNGILTNERSITRKVKELVLALQIERLYTKDQILQMYLNEIPYGSTLYGVESAAQSYFGKPAKDLTLDEAAFLAAIPQAPDFYSPYGTGIRGDNRDKLVTRQHLILNLMADQGYVTKEQAEEVKGVDTLVKLLPKKMGEIKAPHFVTYVRSLLVETYGQRIVEQGGLRVTTSIDWDMQQIGEEEVLAGVETRGGKYGFSNSALVAIDPKTGQILTMVGSKDFFDQENDGQVNVALRPRQPGSSFKPIVYAAGFLKGYTPNMTLWDVNTKFKTDIKDYEPKNYDFGEHGPISVRMALQGSLNIPAVKMLYLVGVGRVLDFAEQLGYSTFGDRSRFGLSLVLGGGEVLLLDHVNAFATFANEGVQVPTTAILKVEDSKGTVLEEWKSSDGTRIVDRDVALTLSDVLSDNNARAYVFGTNNNLTLPGRPVAAKTGTTNNFHDAWTVGYVPSLAAGVWVGNNDNTEMSRGADGSVIAAPIWQAFMKRALEGTSVDAFPKPKPPDTTKPILLGRSQEVTIKIDTISGKRATEFTPADLVEERTYHEAHCELWYIDKDDPRGPAPSSPQDDPQFWNWENAVLAWAEKSEWNTTSTPPTEDDDLHLPGMQPTVSISSPEPNATWSSRDAWITAYVSASRRITRIDATMEGVAIGSAIEGATTFQVHVPNTIGIGYHDLTVTATDDVGNRGTATVSINLTAEAAPMSVFITSPGDNEQLTSADFPVTIAMTANDITRVKKVDVFLQEAQTGDTRLLASELLPQGISMTVRWDQVPSAGTYYLFTVITYHDDSTSTGGRITVRIASDGASSGNDPLATVPVETLPNGKIKKTPPR